MPTIALEHVTKYYQAGRHGWTEKQIELGVEDVSLTRRFCIRDRQQRRGQEYSAGFDFRTNEAGSGRCPAGRQGFIKADALELHPDHPAVWKGSPGAVPDPEDDGGGEFNACRPGWKKAGIRQTITRAD